MDDPSLWTFALLALAGLFAGFVDAVVGGGGLVLLPALVVAFPGAAPVQVPGHRQARRHLRHLGQLADLLPAGRPDPRTFVPLMVVAFLGSAVGAVAASHIPEAAFDPLILVALVVVGAYVLLRPDLGEVDGAAFSGHRHTAAAVLAGLAIGFYDGALGPGTGSFFVFTLVGLLGYSFLEASAKAGSPTGPPTSPRCWSSPRRARWSGRSASSWGRATCSAATSGRAPRWPAAAGSSGSSSSSWSRRSSWHRVGRPH